MQTDWKKKFEEKETALRQDKLESERQLAREKDAELNARKAASAFLKDEVYALFNEVAQSAPPDSMTAKAETTASTIANLGNLHVVTETSLRIDSKFGPLKEKPFGIVWVQHLQDDNFNLCQQLPGLKDAIRMPLRREEIDRARLDAMVEDVVDALYKLRMKAQ